MFLSSVNNKSIYYKSLTILFPGKLNRCISGRISLRINFVRYCEFADNLILKSFGDVLSVVVDPYLAACTTERSSLKLALK